MDLCLLSPGLAVDVTACAWYGTNVSETGRSLVWAAPSSCPLTGQTFLREGWGHGFNFGARHACSHEHSQSTTGWESLVPAEGGVTYGEWAPATQAQILAIFCTRF